jgi:hypothetical protein
MGLGSGIRKKPIPDPGSRGQKGTGSRIRIRSTAVYEESFVFFLSVYRYSYVFSSGVRDSFYNRLKENPNLILIPTL